MKYQDAQDRATVALVKHYQTACQWYSTNIPDMHFEMPNLEFKQRGKIAGSAWLQKHLIRLNPVLLRENQVAFEKHVIPHELAHLMVYKQYRMKVKPHGKEWQFIMNEIFDLPALVNHPFDTSSVAQASFTYRCACQEHQLTLIRHNKVVKGKQKYVCKHCEMPLLRHEFSVT